MGFFSSDDSDETDVSDERVDELVAGARSETVTRERLTKTDTSGIVARGITLNDEPLIEYLDEGEAAHFVFFTTISISPVKFPASDSAVSNPWNATAAFCVTDRRIVLVLSGARGDTSVSIPFTEIEAFEAEHAGGGFKIDAHRLTLQLGDAGVVEEICSALDEEYSDFEDTDTVSLLIANAFDESDVDEVAEYLRMAIRETEMRSADDEAASEETIVTGLTVSAFDMENGFAPEIPSGKDLVAAFRESSLQLGEEYELPYEDVVSVGRSRRGSIEGMEVVTGRDEHVMMGYDESDDQRFPDEVVAHVRERASSSPTDRNAEFDIIGPYDEGDASIRIEGWTDGSSEIDADVDATAESRGRSRGVEVGPFSRSKTASKTTVAGDISGEITDNTYQAEVRAVKAYSDTLSIFTIKQDGGILSKQAGRFHMAYEDIDTIYDTGRTVVVEFGGTTFRIQGVPADNPVADAIEFIRSQPSYTEGQRDASSQGSAEKLRELKELHEDGVLTDEEFASKKEELLEDF